MRIFIRYLKTLFRFTALTMVALLREFHDQQQRHPNEIELINGWMDEANMNTLANAIAANFPTIEKVNLWNNYLGPRCANYISRIILCSSLTYLHLGQNRLGSKGMHFLSNALKDNLSLEHIDLWDNGIGSEGILSLIPFIAVSKLRRLNLGKNNIGAKACHEIFAALPPTIEELRMFETGIDDDGMQQVTPRLQSFPLTVLVLGNNAIGDGGCRTLFQNLPSSISVIDLYNNHITSTGLDIILRRIPSLPVCKEVNLVQNKIAFDAKTHEIQTNLNLTRGCDLKLF